MKVALIHDWLTGMRGGERVLECMIDVFPDADIFTLFHIEGSVSKKIENQKITTSWLQKIPFLKKRYRYFLPFFPLAAKTLRPKGYDVVISSCHCVSKGISLPKSTTHFCYCYTPMRYLWALEDDYFKLNKTLASYIFPLFGPYLKYWDLKFNKTVDHFIGISDYISDRINRYYDRYSYVVYPPVDTDFFQPSNNQPIENYYLVASAFAPYKRIDLAIEAFNRLNLPLLIIGNGQEEKRLRQIAKSNITFLGWKGHDELRKYLASCKAFIFPGEEDFGIAPIEAMATGRPVIAYAKGGALETITPETGVFFDKQTPEALVAAVQDFETRKNSFDSAAIRQQAVKFSKDKFKARLKSYVEKMAVA